MHDDLPLLTKTQSIDMRQRQARESDWSEFIEENHAAVGKGWSEPMKRAKRSMTAALFVLTLAAGSVLADTVTTDGYYECARGSNGRAYCKRQGQGDRLFMVTDSYFARYANETPRSQPGSQPQATTNIVSGALVIALKNDAADIRGLAVLFKGMIEEQRKLTSPDDANVAQQSISLLTQRVQELEAQYQDKSTQLSSYGAPIRPDDVDLQTSARRASELGPRIPYYIPGTPETGEFWLEPVVSNIGELIFNLKFIDPSSKDRAREIIELTPAQLELTRNALHKVADWSKTAHDNGIRKDFSKRAICFPQKDCAPEDGPKVDKVSSTEIIFRIYENGSTAGRIQHNKGLFASGYNISVESSVLLQAYLNHVLLVGKKEFDAGSRNSTQLHEMFK